MRKKILVAAAAVAVLLIVTGIALVFLLDVDRCRPDIEKAIAAKTGRDVKVGRLQLRLFPVTELQAGGFTIGEDPRFGTEPFLKADRLFVRVDLWPLLSRHLRVDALTIDAPRIRLVRDADGRWAYASLLEGSREGGGAPSQGGAPVHEPGGPGPGGGPPAQPGAGNAGAVSGGTASGFSLSVRNLRITKGSLTVADAHQSRTSDASGEVKEIDLSVNDLSAGAVGGFDLSFLLPGAGAPRARLTGKSLSLSADRAEI